MEHGMAARLQCAGLVLKSKSWYQHFTSEGFMCASVLGRLPECPLGSLLIFSFPLLLQAASHYPQHPGSPVGLNWVLPQSRLQTRPCLEQQESLQSSYPEGNGGAPSCWPGASTWHTAKC